MIFSLIFQFFTSYQLFFLRCCNSLATFFFLNPYVVVLTHTQTAPSIGLLLHLVQETRTSVPSAETPGGDSWDGRGGATSHPLTVFSIGDGGVLELSPLCFRESLDVPVSLADQKAVLSPLNRLVCRPNSAFLTETQVTMVRARERCVCD